MDCFPIIELPRLNSGSPFKAENDDLHVFWLKPGIYSKQDCMFFDHLSTERLQIAHIKQDLACGVSDRAAICPMQAVCMNIQLNSR